MKICFIPNLKVDNSYSYNVIVGVSPQPLSISSIAHSAQSQQGQEGLNLNKAMLYVRNLLKLFYFCQSFEFLSISLRVTTPILISDSSPHCEMWP